MDVTRVEEAILDRFYEKSRIAGGVRTGYMLRREAVTALAADHPDLDFEAGLASLVDKGLLLQSESGKLFYLSESGSELVAARGS